jgi:isoquinoline 1-oxidoreductase beta subunit
MVYASIERPPTLGGKVKSYQDQEALQVPGVRKTVPVEPFKPPHGLQPLGGVVAILPLIGLPGARVIVSGGR